LPFWRLMLAFLGVWLEFARFLSGPFITIASTNPGPLAVSPQPFAAPNGASLPYLSSPLLYLCGVSKSGHRHRPQGTPFQFFVRSGRPSPGVLALPWIYSKVFHA